MPNNPHIIRRQPADPGAAGVSVDLRRRIESLESKQGYFGEGAAVTGGWIGTSDTAPSVYMQGDLFGTAGLFCTDSIGNVGLGIVPDHGLVMSLSSIIEGIDWVQGAPGVDTNNIGQINCNVDDASDADLAISVQSPNGTRSCSVILQANNTAAGDPCVQATAGGGEAILVDSTGSGIWTKGIGFFNIVPPTTKPGTPSTLAGVISVLQDYGFCA